MSRQDLNGFAIGKTSCAKLKNIFIKADIYGDKFEFLLPNDQKKYKSLLGTLMSIISILLILLYGIYKTSVLID